MEGARAARWHGALLQRSLGAALRLRDRSHRIACASRRSPTADLQKCIQLESQLVAQKNENEMVLEVGRMLRA